MMRLPLTFVTFAIMPLHMYKGTRDLPSSFLVPHTRTQSNDVVYGAIFLLSDADYYTRALDAYHLCSLHVLRRNHEYDAQHRVTLPATPISFNTVDELSRLMYTEREPTHVSVYVGNPQHPKIQKCLRTTARRRVNHGVDTHPLTNLLREVLHERLV